MTRPFVTSGLNDEQASPTSSGAAAKLAPKLSLVESQPETPGARAQRMFEEARAVASEQVAALDAAMVQVRRLAGEIVDGGDLYPAGIRDVCRRMVEDLGWRSKTLTLLVQNGPGAAPRRPTGPD
jgi:hypothetical protein